MTHTHMIGFGPPQTGSSPFPPYTFFQKKMHHIMSLPTAMRGSYKTPSTMFTPLFLILLVLGATSSVPIPEDSPTEPTISKRTPSPEDLEERRSTFIKALGGGGGDGSGGGGLLTSLSGLGSLATDVVTLLTSNANETFAPLREAQAKARANFPDLGTSLSRTLKRTREYGTRAFRSLSKNARTKITNILRFSLQLVTRLASTVGGLYNVLISVLDVVTRGVNVGARAGGRLLSGGANFSAQAIASSTKSLSNLLNSGVLLKPATQAVSVGNAFFKGVSEDLFDKVEWTNEGIMSKLELAQALAPNFLLRAHETAQSTNDATTIDASPGGYSSSSNVVETKSTVSSTPSSSTMKRDVTTTESAASSTSQPSTTNATASTTSEPGSTSNPELNQGLLNDIFGLQEQIKDLKNTTTAKT